MPRATPSRDEFRHPALAEFVDQLRYAKLHVLRDHMLRAEQLHDDLKPEQNYPLDFLIFRITRHHPDDSPAENLAGDDARHDLRLIIAQLSGRLDINDSPHTTGKPDTNSNADSDADGKPFLEVLGEYHTVKSLMQRWGVSARTLGRYRQRGLRWRMVKFGQTKRRVMVYTPAAVEAFERENAEELGRAHRFQRTTDDERARLLDRARRVVEAVHERNPGCKLPRQRVIQHLARRTGRAAETIRTLFEEHDRAAESTGDGEAMIFGIKPAITRKDARLIRRAHRRGEPMSELARRFRRRHGTMLRLIHLWRLRVAQRVKLRHQHSRVFDRDDADEVLLSQPALPVDDDDLDRAEGKPLSIDDPTLAPLFQIPPLTRDAALRLSTRSNYLRYRAEKARASLDRLQPAAKVLDRFEDSVRRAGLIRDELVRRHLPALRSIVERQLDKADPDREDHRLHFLAVGLDESINAIDDHNPFRDRSIAGVMRNRLLKRFAAEPPEPHDPNRAHRRVGAEEIERRLLRVAARRNVRLIPPEKQTQ